MDGAMPSTPSTIKEGEVKKPNRQPAATRIKLAKLVKKLPKKASKT